MRETNAEEQPGSSGFFWFLLSEKQVMIFGTDHDINITKVLEKGVMSITFVPDKIAQK